MKKKIKKYSTLFGISLVTLLLIISTTLLNQSCSKEEKIKDEKTIKNSCRLMGDSLEDHIIEFIELLNDVREEPENEDWEDINYSDEETVWNIEAALNFHYSCIWVYKEGEDEKDLFYDTDLTEEIEHNESDEFNIVDILEVFDAFAENIEELYDDIDEEDKHLIVVDVSAEDIVGDGEINMMGILGAPKNLSINKDWYWGFDLGDCDGNEVGYDAIDVIKSDANNYTPACFWVNVITITKHPNDVPTTSNPYGYESSQLFSYERPPDPCICSNALKYYSAHLSSIASDYDIYLYKDISFMNLKEDLMPSGNNPYPICHYTLISYGEYSGPAGYINWPNTYQ